MCLKSGTQNTYDTEFFLRALAIIVLKLRPQTCQPMSGTEQFKKKSPKTDSANGLDLKSQMI